MHALERFSFECRKTKTKVITLTNYKHVNNKMDQSEFEANTCSRRQARENTCDQVMIGFGFVSHWLKSGASFVNQSQSAVKQNQSNSRDT